MTRDDLNILLQARNCTEVVARSVYMPRNRSVFIVVSTSRREYLVKFAREDLIVVWANEFQTPEIAAQGAQLSRSRK